jgi:cobalt-zinc-cadmium efflux system outer membrane protein
MSRLVLIFLAILIYSGCSKQPLADDGEVSSIIASKITTQVQWYRGCPEDVINDSIQILLANELTPETAIQIAFLKNPKVQSTFEELGIAHADLIEAGLLSNPDFSLEVRYPNRKMLVTNIEYLVTATFLDIFMIPLRTRLAAAEFEQAKRRVTYEILELAFEVRQTYYELLAHQQILKYTLSIVELTNIQAELISRQNSVGNVNKLDFQQIQAKFLEAKLDIAKEQNTIIRLREKLNRLLGLNEDVCLILPEIPQELDYAGFDLCALEALALTQRMDLQEARFETIRLSRMLGLKEGWTYTNLKAGLAGERDPDGVNLVGFGISGELPLFNFGQAARMRIFARLRQAQNRYIELEIRILSEVRLAHKLLMSNLSMINDYLIRIIPLQKEISASSEELYNVMGLGVDRLIENKRQQLEASRNYFEILKDYWIARVMLDKALGGNLFRLLAQDDCVEGVLE